MTQRSDYEERVERLTASARTRTSEATARAHRAITALQARGAAVNFNTVAREGSVSKDFLYGSQDLAARIRELRSTRMPIIDIPRAQRPSEDSARVQLTVLRESNADLRAENDQLRRENAALRGEIMRLRRR
jgi:hypothetical protein